MYKIKQKENEKEKEAQKNQTFLLSAMRKRNTNIQ